MSTKRARVINYRKVEYLKPLTKGENLEALVNEFLKAYPTRGDRTVWNGSAALDCLNARIVANEGTYLYLVGYTAGDLANTVEKNGSSSIDIVSPPANSEFVDGAVAILISSNNLFYCGENLRDPSIVRYLAEILQKKSTSANDDFDKATSLMLSKKANDAVLKRVSKDGVASISLDAGLHEVEQQYMARKGEQDLPIQLKVLGKIAKEFSALTTKDTQQSKTADEENIFINLEIKFNRVLKGGALGQEKVKKIATSLLDSDEGGFEIITFSGARIRHDELILKKNVNLPVNGKAFDYLIGWEELKKYKEELVRTHLLVA